MIAWSFKFAFGILYFKFLIVKFISNLFWRYWGKPYSKFNRIVIRGKRESKPHSLRYSVYIKHAYSYAHKHAYHITYSSISIFEDIDMHPLHFVHFTKAWDSNARFSSTIINNRGGVTPAIFQQKEKNRFLCFS